MGILSKPGTRTWLIGVAAVVIIIGLSVVISAIGTGSQPLEQGEKVNVLANSKNECVVCHQRTTPGIVEQYGGSTMAAAEVSCQQCHEVAEDYPGAVSHEGTFVLASPSAAMCEKCHATEVAQFNQSRHALPAYVAYAGSKELSAEHLAM